MKKIRYQDRFTIQKESSFAYSPWNWARNHLFKFIVGWLTAISFHHVTENVLLLIGICGYNLKLNLRKIIKIFINYFCTFKYNSTDSLIFIKIINHKHYFSRSFFGNKLMKLKILFIQNSLKIVRVYHWQNRNSHSHPETTLATRRSGPCALPLQHGGKHDSP